MFITYPFKTLIVFATEHTYCTTKRITFVFSFVKGFIGHIVLRICLFRD